MVSEPLGDDVAGLLIDAGEERDLVASHLLGEVFTRVPDANDDPGSLIPMCPLLFRNAARSGEVPGCQ